MSLKPKITDEEKQDIISDYRDNGLLLKDLVKKYGRKAKTIRDALKDAGIRIEYNRSRKIDSDTRDRVIEDYKSGKSIMSIAQSLSISHGSVGNILKQRCINTRPSGDPNQWTDEEVEKLKTLASDRTKTYYEISCHLNRSVNAVEQKCRLIGLPERETKGLFGNKLRFDNILFRSESEVKFARFLASKNIKYEYEKSICDKRSWTCDFYLPFYRLWIEVDGMGQSRRLTKSHSEKIEFYKEQNFNVIFIKPNHSIKRWYNQITHSCKKKEWSKENISLSRIKRVEAENILTSHHYTKNPGANSCVYYGIFENNILIGAVSFGTCTGPTKQYEQYVSSKNNIRELSRMAILPEYGRNIESYCLSKALKMFKADNPNIELVITFSRPDRLHYGYIYQATNWYYFGKSAPGKEYINHNQEEYPWTRFKNKPKNMSRRQYAESLGFVRRKTPPKFIYGYFFNKKNQPDAIMPYPKLV